MDIDGVALIIGGAGVLLVVLSAVISRGNRGTDRRLAAVERRLRLVMDHVGMTEPEAEATDIVAHLMRGEKIQAIKLYRERTGVGLREAKEAVEEIARQRGV